MKDKLSLPSSGAGLTRYFEESKSKFQLKPDWIILIAALVAFSVWLLHVVMTL